LTNTGAILADGVNPLVFDGGFQLVNPAFSLINNGTVQATGAGGVPRPNTAFGLLTFNQGYTGVLPDFTFSMPGYSASQNGGSFFFSAAAEAPEPSTWFMMAAGLALVVVGARRTRKG